MILSSLFKIERQWNQAFHYIREKLSDETFFFFLNTRQNAENGKERNARENAAATENAAV